MRGMGGRVVAELCAHHWPNLIFSPEDGFFDVEDGGCDVCEDERFEQQMGKA